jgi:type III pantothenate kinase
VVVNAGTAVTIDALDAEPLRGSVILPGLELMLYALADKTAALKRAPGRFEEFPTNTADALFSGAVLAVCGAIERMRRAVQRGDGDVLCLLAGGAAALIAPHLGDGAEIVPHLVLEGVLALAGAE